MKFAVIGGDLRHVILSGLLASDGHEVRSLAQGAVAAGPVRCVSDVSDAVGGADCIILPMPVARCGGILNTPRSLETYTLSGLFSKVSECQMVFGGRVDDTTADIAAGFGVEVTDYLKREELAVRNADITAEGAVKIIIEETVFSVTGSKCLVIGSGRIGKALSMKLRALGADVTVSARKPADLARIAVAGCRPAETAHLSGALSEYDVVVNTVPAMVMDADLLGQLKKDCFCLDLASAPGGIDKDAAAKLGLHSVWALSLPGETAPESAGAVIRDTIYNILRERGAAV